MRTKSLKMAAVRDGLYRLSSEKAHIKKPYFFSDMKCVGGGGSKLQGNYFN